MTHPPPRPDRDALLNPFESELPRTPEVQMLSGAGWMTEAARFWTHRAKAYASYIEKLSRCSSFEQVAALQTTFWTDLQRDYANELAAITAAATLNDIPAFARDVTPLAWSPPAPRRRPARAAALRDEVH